MDINELMKKAQSANSLRLDASESVWLARELESIDSENYATLYELPEARQLIPTQGGIPDWARVYTWRETDQYGAAKIIANMADDLPQSNVSRVENSKQIKWVGQSYGYDLSEIKASVATGVGLDRDRATAALESVNYKLDDVLSTGDADYGLEGILTLSNTGTFTPSTKAAGGLTWGTMEAPNATADEVARDLMGIATDRVVETKQRFKKYVIAIPVAQYAYASQVRLGDTQITALQFAKATSPYIEDIVPWDKCDLAGGGGTTDRMLCYPRDRKVVAGIVPMEAQSLPVQQKMLKYVVPMIASTGGVVCRYPVAVSYGDGI